MTEANKEVTKPEINKATGKPMPKFVTRKKSRRYYVADENGVLKESQVAGAPADAGVVGVWGVTPPVDYGTGSSTDEQDTGEVQEFPDQNGEAQGLIFLNNHAENTYEFLVHSDTTPPAFGDLIDTDKYVTRVQKRGQAKGWTTLSVSCRSI
jgi:hypothetical protein